MHERRKRNKMKRKIGMKGVKRGTNVYKFRGERAGSVGWRGKLSNQPWECLKMKINQTGLTSERLGSLERWTNRQAEELLKNGDSTKEQQYSHGSMTGTVSAFQHILWKSLQGIYSWCVMWNGCWCSINKDGLWLKLASACTHVFSQNKKLNVK